MSTRLISPFKTVSYPAQLESGALKHQRASLGVRSVRCLVRSFVGIRDDYLLTWRTNGTPLGLATTIRFWLNCVSLPCPAPWPLSLCYTKLAQAQDCPRKTASCFILRWGWSNRLNVHLCPLYAGKYRPQAWRRADQRQLGLELPPCTSALWEYNSMIASFNQTIR